MKTIEFFKRKGYNPKYETIGGEVMMDGLCIGEWNGYPENPSFRPGDDAGHISGIRFSSLEECARWIAECDGFKRDHDYYNGAYHYYFDTKTGYDHIANYLRHFPLIEKYTIEIEA